MAKARLGQKLHRILEGDRAAGASLLGLPSCRVQLHLPELPLVAVLHRRSCRQDGVDVVAVPLQTHLVKPAASLHGDETFIREDTLKAHARWTIEKDPPTISPSSEGAWTP